MLGYCTNVHAGGDFAATMKALETHAVSVRDLHAPDEVLPIGLWLSEAASREVDAPALVDRLASLHLQVFTMNGFPYGDFHQKQVGRDVYAPDWRREERLDYTLRLAGILAQLMPGTSAGISTLPLGWGEGWSDDEAAASMLRRCVQGLVDLEDRTGRCVHLDIEPEPGCRIQCGSDLAAFVLRWFDDDTSRRYIRVCHDTAHAAVMREPAESAIAAYASAGLRIGKVQVSAAVAADFGGKDHDAWSAMQTLNEGRYLHQTTVDDGDRVSFFADLPAALAEGPRGNWRVHFHVPVNSERFGPLGTTQSDLIESIPLLAEAGARDWEVETYTWDVVPDSMRCKSLPQSIARELDWTASQLRKVAIHE